MRDPNRPPAADEAPDSSLSAAETIWEQSPGRSSSPEAPLPEGIGSYRVERRLGRGGMGEVFLAWDERLGRRVAIKRIRHDSAVSTHQRERFRREARAAAGLSHSAIVRVYDLVSDGAGDAIVLEYVEGRTLAELLAAGPLEAAVALSLGRQLAEGLDAAHSAGVIHRDLKAENVIVTPSGEAKILDFGLARPVALREGEDSLTQRGVLLGTYHAMSPEQARGGDVDPRSDLFSLGALLYEMLTGLPPFRGPNALETLRRVLQENPAPLLTVRPDLPAAFGDLLDRLLAKDRDARPRSAREVALALGRLVPGGDAASELPGRMPARGTAPLTPALSPIQTAPTSTLGLSLRHRRGYGIAAVAAALLVAGGALAYFKTREPARLLRVIVARPEIVSKDADSRLELAASGVLSSALSSLASLEGLAPLDPRDASGGGTSPVQMAQTAAADEVLAATLEKEEANLGRVSLRRILGRDGQVVWARTFRVPIDPESLHGLADSVAMELRRAYPDQKLRAGTPDLDVRDEDYAAFLEVKRRIDGGGTNLDSELAQLEAVARSSPRFLEAKILGARVAASQLESKRQTGYRDRGMELIRQAKELAPNDPRPLNPELRIALSAGRVPDAEAVLARLKELQPGDPEILVQRSRIAERQGHLDDALQDLRTAVDRAPSWRNLYQLARLEARKGLLPEAREHFDAVLRQAPGNEWARERLAGMEIDYGDPERGERLLADLVRVSPSRLRFTNLGFARYLQNRYAAAAEAYRRALAMDPDDAITLADLAETEMEFGREPEAQALYRQALARIEESEQALGLPPDIGLTKAQCLARLGRTREAASLVQDVLHQNPDEADTYFGAALVYSLIGERISALDNVQKALERGKSPRWFTGSAFRPLQGDPELRSLLSTRPGTAAHPDDRTR